MLKKCSKAGCKPIEQTRGEIGPGEYYDVIAFNRGGAQGSVLDPEGYGIRINEGEEVPEGVRIEHCVEISPTNVTDFRIVCRKCGKATPWGVRDIPGMEGAGADWTRNKWNKSIGD